MITLAQQAISDLTTAGVLLIITALGVFVTTIGGTIVNIVVALRARAENAASNAEVKADTKVILGHVNSEQTAGKGREATLQKENDLLRQMLAESKQTAALLAQSASHQPIKPGDAPVQVEVVNEPTAPVPTQTIKK